MSSEFIKIIATNKKARHNYQIDSEYEAGIVLVGTEVKSIREGRVSFQDAYADIKNGEMFLRQLHISPYKYAYYSNHETHRTRKLLLHGYEIKKLWSKIKERGYTLIPLKIYFKNNKIKVLIGLGRGKKLYDKRQSIKQKDIKRDLDRDRKKYS
ncbi:MAG: SsrA-binding protein SmpB [Desulfobacula sp.]|jgi:SsrA-binding protein|uniref:SsrA-binding protein SmpB n=2 Tax=Desulfobacula sp. TaxID=2593537 RepID=UPI001D5F0E64|nr:SsrA-binding protein SmpB [Desulfobacula sp.]MBT3805090.1 SsrA-binding protein SmpB [Desulfobacula sp.]MBT4025592.1 SsrA-binding protein SmpB [Desulfobacula sp.]MBT4201438.1 SsrA-binding protein SmpB [Desulfobacula sp.]MBT4507645.1 SsrA-binding protein SmpB [Desulfobacula sp.]